MRPEAPEKNLKGGQFAVFTKNRDFSRLQNKMTMRSLVPQERNNSNIAADEGKLFLFSRPGGLNLLYDYIVSSIVKFCVGVDDAENSFLTHIWVSRCLCVGCGTPVVCKKTLCRN